MKISLSILEYEPDLSRHTDNLAESEALSHIVQLTETGKIHRVHIDVMRPPMIPNRSAFSIELIQRLYEFLHSRIRLTAHLMVPDPFPIIEKMDKFIAEEKRRETVIIIQRESFGSEGETIQALKLLQERGYCAGLCLDLLTSREALTENVIGAADTVLLMTVPMGRGGQRYSEEGTRRIAHFSQRFPNRIIQVDGGMNPRTISIAEKAGARVAVVGSFITRSSSPVRALLELEGSLGRRRD